MADIRRVHDDSSSDEDIMVVVSDDDDEVEVFEPDTLTSTMQLEVEQSIQRFYTTYNRSREALGREMFVDIIAGHLKRGSFVADDSFQSLADEERPYYVPESVT
jgi:phage terminase large subunit-like protein